MSGRPVNPDRQTAIELGFTTYTGSPHSKCGTTKRYVSGGGCVHCARRIATEQREARKFLKKQAAEIDGRGDQGGGYPSSQGPLGAEDTGDFSQEMLEALEADGEKLRQLTGEDHGPTFIDEPEVNQAAEEELDEQDAAMHDEMVAEARGEILDLYRKSIDDLM
jgi:hypothetical protein